MEAVVVACETPGFVLSDQTGTHLEKVFVVKVLDIRVIRIGVIVRPTEESGKWKESIINVNHELDDYPIRAILFPGDAAFFWLYVWVAADSRTYLKVSVEDGEVLDRCHINRGMRPCYDHFSKELWVPRWKSRDIRRIAEDMSEVPYDDWHRDGFPYVEQPLKIVSSRNKVAVLDSKNCDAYRVNFYDRTADGLTHKPLEKVAAIVHYYERHIHLYHLKFEVEKLEDECHHSDENDEEKKWGTVAAAWNCVGLTKDDELYVQDDIFQVKIFDKEGSLLLKEPLNPIRVMKEGSDWLTFLPDQFGNLYVMESQDFAEGAAPGWCIYSCQGLKERLLDLENGGEKRLKKAQVSFKAIKPMVTLTIDTKIEK